MLTPKRLKEIMFELHQVPQCTDELFAEIERLKEALRMSGNALGLVVTMLAYHGRPSAALSNCIEQMRMHEKMTLIALGEK